MLSRKVAVYRKKYLVGKLIQVSMDNGIYLTLPVGPSISESCIEIKIK